MQLSLPAGKAEYNFDEAATVLGLSSGELKELVLQRLAQGAAARNVAKMRFRPADLIMLNMVHGASMAGAAVD